LRERKQMYRIFQQILLRKGDLAEGGIKVVRVEEGPGMCEPRRSKRAEGGDASKRGLEDSNYLVGALLEGPGRFLGSAWRGRQYNGSRN